MIRAAALPLVLALAFLVAVPASAAAPVIETGSFEIDYVAFETSPCPGIVVHNHEVGTYQTRSYYDNDGNLIRVQTHYNGTDNFYNPLKPGFFLSGSFAADLAYDARTGELSAHGVPYHVTAPGYGTVLVRAGRWLGEYPNGQVAGKNSFVDPQDIDQFCSLLR